MPSAVSAMLGGVSGMLSEKQAMHKAISVMPGAINETLTAKIQCTEQYMKCTGQKVQSLVE